MGTEVMVVSPSLNKRVGTYWTNRSKMDKTGLVLLDECIINLSDNKNWDPLSRFISRSAALNSSDRSRVMGVVRAAFGDQITYKKDASHPTGGKIGTRTGITFADVKLLNSYGVVKEAIVGEKGFRDADMHKKLKDMSGPPKRNPVEVAKAAAHIVTYLKNAKIEATGAVMAEVQKLLAAKAAVVVDKDGQPDH